MSDVEIELPQEEAAAAEVQADEAPTEEQVAAYLNQALVSFQAQTNADIFVVSGGISRGLADDVVEIVRYLVNRRPNVVVFLCTYGGDADAAYVIAKTFQKYYEKFSLYVSGYCKSAGTIIALGADEVVLSQTGELGPLDVQLLRDDTIAYYASGLDVHHALSSLKEEAFSMFDRIFIGIIAKSRGSITTRTAASIAADLTIGLLSPITSQLDPLKIGEMRRAMDIAYEYGVRLGADPEKVARLINDYPSHSFVIDADEARLLFNSVREYDLLEMMVETALTRMMRKTRQHESIREPHPDGAVMQIQLEENGDEQPTAEKESTGNDDVHEQEMESGNTQQSNNGAGTTPVESSEKA